jgi:hypothetical protein
MPRVVFARWCRVRAEVHSVPLGPLQQVHVLEGIGTRGKCIQRRCEHGDVASDVLDTAFPEWCASGKKGVRHWFDARKRALARCGIGQIGGNMRETGLA